MNGDFDERVGHVYDELKRVVRAVFADDPGTVAAIADDVALRRGMVGSFELLLGVAEVLIRCSGSPPGPGFEVRLLVEEDDGHRELDAADLSHPKVIMMQQAAAFVTCCARRDAVASLRLFQECVAGGECRLLSGLCALLGQMAEAAIDADLDRFLDQLYRRG